MTTVKIQLYSRGQHALDIDDAAGWLTVAWVTWVRNDRRRNRSRLIRGAPMRHATHELDALIELSLHDPEVPLHALVRRRHTP